VGGYRKNNVKTESERRVNERLTTPEDGV
jgi:hypothetical protein